MAIEVKKDGGFILVEDSTSGVVNESYALPDIKHVDFVQAGGDNIVQVSFVEDSKPYLSIDLSKVTNQPTWTDDAAGLIQAVTDIKSWYLTEATTGQNSGVGVLLGAILAELQKDKDFETLKIRDANGDIFALRATYDETTSTYSFDYIDASGSISTPVAPLEFLNADNVLNLIYQQLLPIQGTDTPDIDFIGTNPSYTLPVGTKSFTVTVLSGTVVFNSGGGNKTLSPGIYKWNTSLDRSFVSVSLDASGVASVNDCFVQYIT